MPSETAESDATVDACPPPPLPEPKGLRTFRAVTQHLLDALTAAAMSTPVPSAAAAASGEESALAEEANARKDDTNVGVGAALQAVVPPQAGVRRGSGVSSSSNSAASSRGDLGGESAHEEAAQDGSGGKRHSEGDGEEAPQMETRTAAVAASSSALGDGSGEPPPPPPPPQQLGLFDADATAAYKQLRLAVAATETKAEVQSLLSHDASGAVVTEFLECVAPLVVADPTIALYACVVVANMCVIPLVHEVVCGPALLEIALLALSHHPQHKKLVHLSLMTVSNVALGGAVSLSPAQAQAVVAAVAPLYHEPRVVEAWASALCNLAACCGAATTAALIECGAMAPLERLLLFHGDDARIAYRGLQALSHLCAGHIDIPPVAS